MDSVQCHTFVTLHPALGGNTRLEEISRLIIYVFFTGSGEWLLSLCTKFLNFPTVFPYVELNSF